MVTADSSGLLIIWDATGPVLY